MWEFNFFTAPRPLHALRRPSVFETHPPAGHVPQWLRDYTPQPKRLPMLARLRKWLGL